MVQRLATVENFKLSKFMQFLFSDISTDDDSEALYWFFSYTI